MISLLDNDLCGFPSRLREPFRQRRLDDPDRGGVVYSTRPISRVMVVCGEAGLPNAALLDRLRQCLHESFGIDHTTLQVEPEEYQEGEVHA